MKITLLTFLVEKKKKMKLSRVPIFGEYEKNFSHITGSRSARRQR